MEKLISITIPLALLLLGFVFAGCSTSECCNEP